MNNIIIKIVYMDLASRTSDLLPTLSYLSVNR